MSHILDDITIQFQCISEDISHFLLLLSLQVPQIAVFLHEFYNKYRMRS